MRLEELLGTGLRLYFDGEPDALRGGCRGCDHGNGI